MVNISVAEIKKKLSFEDDEYDEKIQSVLDTYLASILRELRPNILSETNPSDCSVISAGICLVLAGYFLLELSNREEDAEEVSFTGLKLPASDITKKRLSRSKSMRTEGWALLEDYKHNFMNWEVV